MTDNFRLTGLRVEFIDEVLELQRLLWAADVTARRRYLNWKFHENPYLDDRLVVLGWAGDQLAGMVAGFGARWERPDTGPITLPCVADTVIEPTYRGGPLFRLMLTDLIERTRLAGFPWLLDFGDQPASAMMIMNGWQAVGPWAVARRRRGETNLHVASFAGPRSGNTIVITDPPSFVEMADFIDQLGRSTRIRHVRDPTYLTWRDSNPLATYEYLVSRRVHVNGYAVIHQALAGPEIAPATIVECEAVQDEVWLDLVEIAATRCRSTHMHIWARDHEPKRLQALETLGFELKAPTGRLTRDTELPNLLVKRIPTIETERDLSQLGDSEAWDLRAVCGRSWR